MINIKLLDTYAKQHTALTKRADTAIKQVDPMTALEHLQAAQALTEEVQRMHLSSVATYREQRALLNEKNNELAMISDSIVSVLF